MIRPGRSVGVEVDRLGTTIGWEVVKLRVAVGFGSLVGVPVGFSSNGDGGTVVTGLKDGKRP